jgi:uncharacterized delta-60 repeat protein
MPASRTTSRARSRYAAALAALTLAGTLFASAQTPAQAAPGDYDPAFVGAGRAPLGLGFRVVGLDGLTDDRFVVVSIRSGNNDALDVRRFTPTGTPDLSFAGSGFVQFGGAAEWGAAEVAADSARGYTYVSAYSQNGEFSRIWRFGATGALDPAWGGTGRVDFNASRLLDIDLQPDGRLIVANSASVYRLTATGTIDTTFGSGGGTTLATGQVDNLAILPDGGILAGGRSASSIDVFRLGVNGAIDGDFGTNGRASHRPTPPLGWTVASIEPVTIGVQNDGGVVVASGVVEQNAANNSTRSPLIVTRFHEGGGSDGKFSTMKNYAVSVSGKLAVQADDKIVVPIVSAGRASLYRLQDDGDLDSTFGVGGGWSDAEPDSRPTAALVQRPGRIVVSGFATGKTGLLWGFVGDPTPTCSGEYATAYGHDRADVLYGTDGDDVIVGGGGKDTVKAWDGNDVVCGGEGKDLLIGGKGKDLLRGQGDADVLRGDGGKDRLQGGGGADKLQGGKAKDKLSGGPGKDVQRQ